VITTSCDHTKMFGGLGHCKKTKGYNKYMTILQPVQTYMIHLYYL
jgi:hypothetical protein